MHPVGLLRPGRERPRGAAEQRDERAALHYSIASSARSSTATGSDVDDQLETIARFHGPLCD
jgi:hypothetical protein